MAIFIGVESVETINTFGSLICKQQSTDAIPVVPNTPIIRPTNTLGNNERQLNDQGSIYKDISQSFLAHPLTGDPVRVFNFASINQALRAIILTDRTERPMSNIDFGSNIKARLFDVFTPATERAIREDIQREILNFEPRVLIKNVKVNRSQDLNGMIIRIEYKIKTFNQTTEFELFLERV